MDDQDSSVSVKRTDLDEAIPQPVGKLGESSVHVWEVSLVVSETSFVEDRQLLSPDELARASRFHFEKDARKFTTARGRVRSILSQYTGLSPRELSFENSPQGKPSLSHPAKDIRFSVSHSGDKALIAVSLGFEVGVDIEHIRPDVETDKLAARFFSAAECSAIRALPAQCQVSAFFRCWTSKEAFLKAQGVGLSRELGSFDVEVDPSRRAQLLATRPDSTEVSRWNLYDLGIDDDYAAALAAGRRLEEITIFRSPRC